MHACTDKRLSVYQGDDTAYTADGSLCLLIPYMNHTYAVFTPLQVIE